MQTKSCYFPSPLKRDYLTKPLLSMIPIIPTARSQPEQSSSTSTPILNLSPFKYLDGIMIPVSTKNIKKDKKLNDDEKNCGIFIMRDHTAILYTMQKGILCGTNYFVYMSGTILAVDYDQGVVNGWMIVISPKLMLAQMWKKNKKSGLQYSYSFEESLLIISDYKNDELLLIQKAITGQLYKILAKQVILLSRIDELKNKILRIPSNFPQMNTTDLKYYGELSYSGQSPQGYGVLFYQSEVFIGHFQNGYLNGLGAIRFQNGNHYIGEFEQGNTKRYGCFLSNDQSQLKYCYDQVTIQKSQFERYIDMQLVPAKQEKWTNKFSVIEPLHNIFKIQYRLISNNSTKNDDEQKSQSNPSQLDSPHSRHSDIKIIIDDFSQKKEQLGSNSSELYSYVNKNQKIKNNDKNIGQNEHVTALKRAAKDNKSNTVPKLSLFEQMQNKQLGDRGFDRSQRTQEAITSENLQKRTQTARNQRKDEVKQTLKALAVPIYKKINQYSNNIGKNEKNRQQKQKNSLVENLNDFRIEEIKNDKLRVSDEYSVMRPNQMKSKKMIYRNVDYQDSMNFDRNRNQNNTKINLGRILHVQSDVGEEQMSKFIKKIGMHNQFNSNQ